MVKKKKEFSFSVGKRKTATARATVKSGKGRVRINSIPLEIWGSEPMRLWIKEPLIIADDISKDVDIDVIVRGGGAISGAEAARQAIAKGLVDFSGSKELKKKYLEYDRNLLVYDFRRTEAHKPSASKRGPRRHKQRSKR
jgi:small subunit ribosomal protein S9